MELWSITALGKVDTEFVVSAFFFLITGQARAQPARLDPNNGIRPRIERVLTVEYLYTNRILFQVFAPAADCLFNDETKKSFQPVDMSKRGARQNAGEVFADLICLQRFRGHMAPDCNRLWRNLP